MLNRFRRRRSGPRALVIGLDCAEPSLVFDRWRGQLPVLGGLMERGIWGPLESVVPPITVPAWSCMLSGRDPGELGIYGFRNRRDYSYDGLTTANGDAVRVPRVWDVLSAAGKQVGVVGVPGTYPPKPVNGHLITCFMTPSTGEQFTWPPAFRDDVLRWAGGDYLLDVREFRTDNKPWLLEQVYTMTDRRFSVAEHMLREQDADCFMLVEMGTDRMHHGFWRYQAPDHPRYEPGNRYERVILDYYRYLDERIGRLLQLVPDDTAVLVVSDHGAKTMHGGIRVNDWLRKEGYLRLSEATPPNTRLAEATIDWSRTMAWGEGGYYARIFCNVAGREPQGVVPPEEHEALQRELKAKLEAISDEDGNPIGTRVFLPREVYREVTGIPPDLIVYFGDLAWRSIGTVGSDAIHTRENDTGPDDANHAPHGICIYANPALPPAGRRAGLQLFDIGRTLLSLFDCAPPPGMRGRVIGGDEAAG
jgi:predicted AlkP superfamily phosphohydrolase/phosphomutase